MQTNQPTLLTRPDTFFGVCEGLGEDLGLHPNILRLALAGTFFWNPLIAGAIYAAAGLLVALLRWLVPNPRQGATEPTLEPVKPLAADPEVQEKVDPEPMQLAA